MKQFLPVTIFKPIKTIYCQEEGFYLKSVFHPKSLSNHFVSSFLMNLFFLLLHTEQWAEIIVLLFFFFFFFCEIDGFLFSVNFLLLTHLYYSFILLIKPRIFNIPIDSPSLDILLLFLPHLSLIVERTNVLLKIFDALRFFNFLYLLHLIQQTFWFIH